MKSHRLGHDWEHINLHREYEFLGREDAGFHRLGGSQKSTASHWPGLEGQNPPESVVGHGVTQKPMGLSCRLFKSTHYRLRPPIKPVTLGELAALPHTETAIAAVAGFVEGASDGAQGD